MSVKFIKNSSTFDSEICWKGLNLLGHAQMIELFIGSKCGGHAECGADRIRLCPEDQKKVNLPQEAELALLTKVDLARGFRIACQCFPNQDDLEIEVILE